MHRDHLRKGRRWVRVSCSGSGPESFRWEVGTRTSGNPTPVAPEPGDKVRPFPHLGFLLLIQEIRTPLRPPAHSRQPYKRPHPSIQSSTLKHRKMSKGQAQLTEQRAEELVRLMTDGLVNIVDKTGEFLMPSE